MKVHEHEVRKVKNATHLTKSALHNKQNEPTTLKATTHKVLREIKATTKKVHARAAKKNKATTVKSINV